MERWCLVQAKQTRERLIEIVSGCLSATVVVSLSTKPWGDLRDKTAAAEWQVLSVLSMI
ncbi:MAG TPA: hypothetical protein VN611_15085 [Patescibacteria group bacterium]|nr:hypothetical protein [Patescibacteria group bacterium]